MIPVTMINGTVVRRALAAAVVFAGLSGAAQANVTYTFSNQAYGGESVARGATLDFTLVVTDAALARGSFTLNQQTGPIAISGDVADFISFSYQVGPADGGFFTPTSGSEPGRFQASLSLGSGFATGSLTALASTSHFALSSSNGDMLIGESDSDANKCNGPQGGSRCSVTGQAVRTAIPEPASLVLLGLGVLGGAEVRRRRLAAA